MYGVSKLITLEEELKEMEKKSRAKPSVERTKNSNKEKKYNQLVKKLQRGKRRLK